jgi:hypothetical protein
MYLEECEAPVVLEENAADTPDITGLCPAQLCKPRWGEAVRPSLEDTGSCQFGWEDSCPSPPTRP